MNAQMKLSKLTGRGNIGGSWRIPFKTVARSTSTSWSG